jgi:hypothetical protein
MWFTILGFRRPRMFDVVREKLLSISRDDASVEFGDHGEIAIRLTTSASSVGEATRLALEKFARLMLTAKLTLEPHTVQTFPYGHHPPVPKLAGAAEIVEILGVSKARVSQLARSADFPSPVARLAMGPVYLESVVWEYQQTREDAVQRRELTKLRLAGAALETNDRGENNR